MKVERKTNFRVVITPRSLGDYGYVRVSDSFLNDTPEEIEQKYRKRCEQIVEDIRKHVDCVGFVEIQHDTDAVCSFCNTDWNQACCDGVPNCCQEAIDEHNRSLTPQHEA